MSTRALQAKTKQIGAFSVRRAVPQASLRSVGPWVFLDHMGPLTVEASNAMDVGPHPHIGLATVTYLFEGVGLHRDSLGSEVLVEPGAINWMTAGRGIVHSERTPPERIGTGMRLHGLQLWIALPKTYEQVEPAFHSHPAASLPSVPVGAVEVRVLVGTAFGATSPVHSYTPTLYLDAALPAGAMLELPAADAEERAVYVASGTVRADGVDHPVGTLLVLTPGENANLEATEDARVAVIGGAPLDGPRLMWWNFVSSSRTALEKAKRDWKNGAFPPVPNDAGPAYALPEEEAHIELIPAKNGGEWVIFRQGEPLGEMTWVWSQPGVMDIVHTGVREALQGGGWARKLVMRGVSYAREHGYTIVPHCSYARKVLTSDEALADLLAPGWQAKL